MSSSTCLKAELLTPKSSGSKTVESLIRWPIPWRFTFRYVVLRAFVVKRDSSFFGRLLREDLDSMFETTSFYSLSLSLSLSEFWAPKGSVH